MTIFISDIHIGSPRSRSPELCDFLSAQRKDQSLFLVGDIFDDAVHWKAPEMWLLRAIMRFSNVIYIPGNHDAAFFHLSGITRNGLTIANHWDYTASDGKRYLVIHGDSFDPTLKLGHGPLWLRHRVPAFLDGIHGRLCATTVANRATKFADSKGFDGVICGHTHRPEIRQVNGKWYANCGDWIEHSTAIIDECGLHLVEATS